MNSTLRQDVEKDEHRKFGKDGFKKIVRQVVDVVLYPFAVLLLMTAAAE